MFGVVIIALRMNVKKSIGINNPAIETDREGILENLLMVVPYNQGANVYVNMES